MYTGTGEPCIGIAHLLAAFPRASALIGCTAGAIFFLLPVVTAENTQACFDAKGLVINGGDAAGAVCHVRTDNGLVQVFDSL